MKHLLLSALLLMGLASCGGRHEPTPTPAVQLPQLPAATETGAGTFGCLLNGQTWTPTSAVGQSTFSVTYDAGLLGGVLQVYCIRKPDAQTVQVLTFAASEVKQAGTYQFTSTGINSFHYDVDKTLCGSYSNIDSGTYQSGSLTLTRFDRASGVVAGTFNFKLYKAGCDTLRLTQGRFDSKF